MANKHTVLTVSEAQAFYNRFGKKQDNQGFYENPALEDLIAHANFQETQRVFEFGCGTGKFAARLLAEYLPASATYLGYDVSPVMIGLAAKRFEAYSERAKALQSDGTMNFPLSDHSADHVICCYVLDLLSDGDIREFFAEAHRVLRPGGRLCLASLTKGITVPSRIVSSLWMAVFHVRPTIVGGCRPIRLYFYVDRDRWQLEHRKVLTPFGVPSEILVLIAKGLISQTKATGGLISCG
jgi:ubiquinone/menaquinone biosynthesis C-methylase UbiE